MESSVAQRPRLAPFAVSVVVAVVAAAGGALLLWSVRDSLPARIATHWGADGMPDGFSSLQGVLASGIGIILVMTVFLAALGWAFRQEVALSSTASGTAVFQAIVLFGTAYAQRGFDDPSDARLTDWLMGGALLAGVAVGGAVALLLRRRVAAAAPSAVPPAARHLTWEGRLRPSAVAVGVLASAAVLCLALGVWMWWSSGLWFVALIGLLLLPMVPMLSSRVTVDASGLRVSALGITLTRVPRERIIDATVTTVSPLGDYGGWGLRAGFDGSWGWVTAEGEALRIRRHDMRDLVFTVGDATGAARTINALVRPAS